MRRIHREGPGAPSSSAQFKSPAAPDDVVPFADKLRQQQETHSVSSNASRRQAVSDEAHSLMSGGTRSKRKPTPVPNMNIKQQNQRPSKSRMRAVLAAFGDCTVKKDDGYQQVSCGVAPQVQNDQFHLDKAPEERKPMNYFRLLVITLIGVSVFGLGKSNGSHAALRGQIISSGEKDALSWSKLDNTNASISSLLSLEKSMQLFSELDRSETMPRQHNNSTFGLENNPNHTYHNAVFPSHIRHLSNLSTPYDATIETPYFWDVHFSGESIAEAVFSTCLGLTLAAEHGLRQPDYDEEKLQVFELDGNKYINSDLTTPEGIQRAKTLGLASSHLADVIVSPYLHIISSDVFSTTSPGRMFAIMRNPVDRAIGMYYYLARATWDPMYNPSLAKMSIAEYAKSKYIENNWLTRFLVKKPRGRLNHSDLLLAKKILKFKCLVGLYDEMEASLARFQRYFNWGAVYGDQMAKAIQCQKDIITNGDKILDHPISFKEKEWSSKTDGAVTEGSFTWNAIAKQNHFDMEVYEYAKRLFKSQGEEIFNIV